MPQSLRRLPCHINQVVIFHSFLITLQSVAKSHLSSFSIHFWFSRIHANNYDVGNLVVLSQLTSTEKKGMGGIFLSLTEIKSTPTPTPWPSLLSACSTHLSFNNSYPPVFTVTGCHILCVNTSMNFNSNKILRISGLLSVILSLGLILWAYRQALHH